MKPKTVRPKQIRVYKDLPLHSPFGLEDVWTAYKAGVRQVGIMKTRRPWPDNPFWKRLPELSEYIWEPCIRSQAMRVTHAPFIGTDKEPCCANNCIIETLEAHRILVGHFGMLDRKQIISVVCETCNNQVHPCCSDQLKTMTMSEIQHDNFEFYCSDCSKD